MVTTEHSTAAIRGIFRRNQISDPAILLKYDLRMALRAIDLCGHLGIKLLGLDWAMC
jgi:hypothetical protein